MRRVKRRPGESTYSFRKRSRVCVWCGSPDLLTRHHCAEHRDRFNAIVRKSAARKRRMARRSADRRKAGLCVRCGQPAANRTHCEEHRVAHNEYLARRRAGRA